jgi:serralysin
MAASDILLLTDAQPGKSAFKLLDTAPLEISKGLTITFDFYAYGGTGGDGFSFIILDGSQSPIKAGGFGGSLGYAKRIDGNVVTEGILGGVVGVGFDEFGNYSNPFEGREGGRDGGPTRDSIAIRGSSASGNPYLAGTDTIASGLDNTAPGANRSNSKKIAKVELFTEGTKAFMSVKADLNADGDFLDPDELVISNKLTKVSLGELSTLPATIRFGFAAATGEATNVHEVGNFDARTASGEMIPIGNRQIIIGDDSKKDTLIGQSGDDTIVGGNGGDQQTGKGGADRFVFSGATKALALKTSLARDPDRITDFNFNQGDKFQLDFDSSLTTPNLPRRLFNAGVVRGGNLRKAAKSVYKDRIASKRGNQALKTDEAIFFTLGGKTYLSVNDDKAGFQANRDLLADVTNIVFKAGDSSKARLSVTDYFV